VEGKRRRNLGEKKRVNKTPARPRGFAFPGPFRYISSIIVALLAHQRVSNREGEYRDERPRKEKRKQTKKKKKTNTFEEQKKGLEKKGSRKAKQVNAEATSCVYKLAKKGFESKGDIYILLPRMLDPPTT
jgi:hypothetical protein